MKASWMFFERILFAPRPVFNAGPEGEGDGELETAGFMFGPQLTLTLARAAFEPKEGRSFKDGNGVGFFSN